MSTSGQAVFLSYASQDAEAARRICATLRAEGVEVWFDADGGLEHGDEWDAKIRRQIKECVLFIPLISANTQARHEGYFRIEWELAAQRALGIASGVPFILPIVIDDTREPDALVPDRFRMVQWTRLPGGEVSPELRQRFVKLWAQRTGASVGPALAPGRIETQRRAASGGPTRNIALVAVLILLAVGRWYWTTLRTPQSAVRNGAAAAPRTEAQQLVAQGRQLLETGDYLNRENYRFVEDLAKKAVASDPGDASAWVLSAEVSYWQVYQGFDASEARRAAMLSQAERARKLAPDLPDAIIVHADVRGSLRREMPEAARDLLALAAKEPANWRVQRSLGQIYRNMDDRAEDMYAAMQRAIDVSGGHPYPLLDMANIMNRRGRFAEGDLLVERAVAASPVTRVLGRLLTFDIQFKSYWRGDFPAAIKSATAMPDWLLRDDRGTFFAWRTYFWAGQPEKALEVAQLHLGDYLRDVFFAGPRAVLTARAHEKAGHAEAAQADWRVVLQLTDRELAATPGDGVALYWKGWALARLGDTVAAAAIGRQIGQQNLTFVPGNLASLLEPGALAALWATLGNLDLAIEALRAKPISREAILPTRVALERDPAFDPLRADPRFQEILANAPAPTVK